MIFVTRYFFRCFFRLPNGMALPLISDRIENPSQRKSRYLLRMPQTAVFPWRSDAANKVEALDPMLAVERVVVGNADRDALVVLPLRW